MTLPGFTAKDSLYRANGHYRTARTHDHMKETVYPAQVRQECHTEEVCDCYGCYEQTTCSCTPSSSWHWDNYGCKVWTDIDAHCQVTITPDPDCRPIFPGRKPDPFTRPIIVSR